MSLPQRWWHQEIPSLPQHSIIDLKLVLFVPIRRNLYNLKAPTHTTHKNTYIRTNISDKMYKLYFCMFASFLLLNSRKRLILSLSLLSCKFPLSLKKVPTTHTHTHTRARALARTHHTHLHTSNTYTYLDLISVELSICFSQLFKTFLRNIFSTKYFAFVAYIYLLD